MSAPKFHLHLLTAVLGLSFFSGLAVAHAAAPLCEQLLVPGSSSSAAPNLLPLSDGAPVSSRNILDLQQFTGQSFLKALMTPGTGIKAQLDLDQAKPFLIPSKEVVHTAARDFEPSVYRKILGLFKNGEAGFDQLIDSMSGQQLTPATLAAALREKLNTLHILKDETKIPLYAVEIAPFLGLASGAGTIVRLNDGNFYYNYGYLSGSDDPDLLAKAVKSGRSFPAGPGHKALDVSDSYYLAELGKYLQATTETSAFYQTLVQTITQCNLCGLDQLSPEGQTLATDFIGVYTAELDRYVMTGLKLHPWQMDLFETTALSAFGVAAKIVAKDGHFVPGTPSDYFGIGRKGSGIGETRQDRRKLQVAVAKAERTLNPQIVLALEQIIGTSKDGDVIHGFMLFVNDPKNETAMQQQAGALTKAMTDYLTQIHNDAAQIAGLIQTNP